MADYNLSGLNPRDFEHLIQALALAEIAPGVTPFGDGRDGGREATFTGRMQYPSTAAPWEGYLVIQAKYRTRPTDDTTDSNWAVQQLRADLNKFADPKRKLPSPQYYLFTTNAVLSAVQGTGGRDRVTSLLEARSSSLQLQGYDVWDFDKICRLLDKHQDIRSRYAAFITSGDILSEMMQMLRGQQPSFSSVISRFLQSDFRADQYVKLEQAGHGAEHKTSLVQVFVDLPASYVPLAEPPSDENDKTLVPRLVNEVLESGSQVLKRSVSNTEVVVPELTSNPEPGRFVIVGGPGQGKSTVGQFLCQIYRAAILKDRSSASLSAEASLRLNEFLRQCETNRMTLPTARRFPVRVVLDQFATDLANGQVRSLMSFILKRINNSSDEQCSAEDLRRWLGAYPWLIVLDGLDEVPASSNREQVLEKISDFWSEVAILDADVLVVATTRPQGYSNDFTPAFYKHRYLAPLSKQRALQYAERLVDAQYGDDPERRSRVLRRLRMACEQTTTQRLMRTPLQITIMATLVDRIGQPPQERWRLFKQYYEVIYQRETEREIPASRILQQRKADVNAIHQRVGLLLQTESEVAGATESQLPSVRFEGLVRARIEEEGYEGQQLEVRTLEITEAALTRLVFLVGLESDRIGFEIRSLQEFMAGEALMDGRDDHVRMRLEAIAPIVHWRNVFLFAAGHCFAERQSYRDMIVTICEQLNDPENDSLAGASLAGSRLALDILEDGLVREQPNYARSLARLAVRLMEHRDFDVNRRLAVVYDLPLEHIFKEQIRNRLRSESYAERLGAWIVLTGLMNQQVSWATEFAEAHWPTDKDEALDVLSIETGPALQEWARTKYIDILPHVNPWNISSRPRSYVESTASNGDVPDWFTPALSELSNFGYRSGSEFLRFSFTNDPELNRFVLRPSGLLEDLPELVRSLVTIPFTNPSWSVIVASARLIANPSSIALSQELRWLKSYWSESMDPNLYLPSDRCPWPLAACLLECRGPEDLDKFADRAQTGMLGEPENWLAAERRWKEQGVSEDDLMYLSDDRWPFDANIARIGFPFRCSNVFLISRGSSRTKLWRKVWAKYESVQNRHAQDWLAEVLLTLLEPYSLRSKEKAASVEPSQLRQFLENKNDIQSSLSEVLEGLNIPQNLTSEWIDFLTWLGSVACDSVEDLYLGRMSAPLDQLCAAYTMDPSRTGLLCLLASFAGLKREARIPIDLLALDRFDSNTVKSSALVLQLTRSRLSEASAKELATAFLVISAEHRTITEWLVYRLRRLARDSPKLAGNAELFALVLREALLDTGSTAYSEWLPFLNERMRTRVSRLGDSQFWSELALPRVS